MFINVKICLVLFYDSLVIPIEIEIALQPAASSLPPFFRQDGGA